MDAFQSILPNWDVFSAPAQNHQARTVVGSGALGAYAKGVMSPVTAAARLGQVDPNAPVTASAAPQMMPLVLSLVVVGVAGALSYQVGKAIAPSGSSETTWGWIAVPAGLLTGPIGLGIMAIVANQKGR